MKILVYFASEPKMSAGISALALTEEDVTKMLAATTHIGSDNSETTMEQYVWKKKTDGVSNLSLSLNLWPNSCMIRNYCAIGEHHQPQENLGEAFACCACCRCGS